MPDIFISYSHADQPIARQFAQAFQSQGFDVWWDTSLRAGDSFDKKIEDALKNAKAVVLLWSKTSASSRWVRAEATLADRNKTLVPAMIEACERPIMFELTQTAELSHWTGTENDPAWKAFLADVIRTVEYTARTVGGRFTNSTTTIAQDARPGAPARTRVAPVRSGLAVMPFTNRSGLKEDNVFAVGMVEDIIDALSLSRNIKVLASGSVATYRKNVSDVGEIGRLLGVRYLMEGNVRRAGDNLRVTAQLIEADGGAILWTQKFDRPLAELSNLQQDLVLEVAGHLGSQIQRVEIESALKKPGDVTAWEARIRCHTATTRGLWLLALSEGERAVALAPGSGGAHATMAFALSGMLVSGLSSDAVWWQRARKHIDRALELDPTNPKVLLWVGWSFARLGQPEEGLPYLERAASIIPNNSVVHHGLGAAYAMLGRLDDAVAELNMIEQLSPGSPNHHDALTWYGLVEIKAGRYERALAAADQSILLMPTFYVAHLVRAHACDLLGQNSEARQSMRRCRELAPGIPLVAFQRGLDAHYGNHTILSTIRAIHERLWSETQAG